MTSQSGGEPVGPPSFPSVGGDAGRAPETPTTVFTPSASPTPEPVTPQPPPVPQTPSSAGGTNRGRWLIAGIATIVVIALLGSLVVFLGSRPPTPSLVARYAPADAAAYVELRYDLPGDQADNLAGFMSHFPGFADRAAFEQKLDETIAKLVGDTDTGLDWATDIKPWFGGQIGAFSSSLEPAVGTPPSFTFAISVSDKAKLDEFVNAHVAEAGANLTSEEYAGATIYSGNVEDLEERISFTATDEALVVSSRLEDLKAALDVKADTKPGLADDKFFLNQLSAMNADRLGLVYSNYGSLMDAGLGSGAPALPGGGLPEGCMESLQSMPGIRAMAEIRAETDHMSFRMRSEFPSGGDIPPAPGNRNAGLTSVMPGNTVAYLEIHQVGQGIGFLINQVMGCIPADSDGMGFDPDQIQQILGVPLDEYFDFLVDAGVAVTLDGGEFGAGVVATVDDEAVANSRVATLLSFVRLAGGMGEGGVTVTDVQHGTATVHLITVPPPTEVFGEPATSEPVTFSVSVANGRFYLGVDDFVTKALDQQAGDSLAAQPHLQSAVNQVGTSNTGVVFVDVDGIWSFVESQMPEESRAQYESEGKPFIVPLSDFVLVTRNDNGINDGHGFLYVE